VPANLTADYVAAEQAFRRAETADERIAALEQMFAALPKHKGTEKMQADLPALSPEFMEPWLAQVVRAAELTALVVDPSEAGVLGHIEFALATFERWRAAPPRLLIANQIDRPGALADFDALLDLYGARFRMLGVSALTGLGLAEFARACFEVLGLVRFYSKPPGRRPDLGVPFVLRRGATVQQAAAHVHRDFAEHLRSARLFGSGRAADGLLVERTHPVEDGDILEFHL
jgi:ribosome-interacting GTPase 1